ncbi:4'-phosphopantetheinyl transferase superfamily protein [Affinibrenneria salicis]|uniref:4'-phosphopantetheinyl transferase superfamily protein n=1 Tax=Affinibrenneria salicis TaxID=2590031 RepID=A0A5J5G4G1_9GAMM|nr:4'-phosphopantetheinyl transferase superfamily protein [Affinibrenneria salicis]KAA9001929.1 4'-phosphopantetheinyl transferase superfamily protein [Affinibrenneria salicis]
MYRVALGRVDALCRETADWLDPQVLAQPLTRQQRAARVLLAKMLDRGVLPALQTDRGGKPRFIDDALPGFNLSHSGDQVLALLSDHGEVGGDVEVIRARPRWRRIADETFSPSCLRWLRRQSEPLPAFWLLWTAHEAALKQQGGSVWQMSALQLVWPDLAPAGAFICCRRAGDIQLALCGAHPFPADLPIETL